MKSDAPLRILYIHMAALGDAVMASPALRLLRRGLPGCELTVLARSHTQDYFRTLAYVDRVIPFVDDRHVNRHKPWTLLRGWPELVRLVRELSSARYTAAIQWRGQIPDTLMNVCTRAPHRVAGVQDIHRRSPLPVENFPFLVTDLVPSTCPGTHMVEAMVAPARHLVAKLGGRLPPDDLRLDYPLQPADRLAAADFMRANSLGEHTPFALLGISTKTAVNQWPAARFAAVADHLQETHGLRVVLNGVPAHLAREEEIVRAMRTAPVRSVGRIAFGPLCALLGHSRLLVSLNTGIAHIAAALHVPAVVLNGRDGASITPWRSPHRVVTKSPFYPQKHPHSREWAGLVPLIQAGDVNAAIDDLLSESHARQN